MRHRGKKKRVITAATEGQRLLRDLGATTRVIAKRTGVSAGLAAQWRTGEKLPAEAKRKKLESLFGIPAKSWDRRAEDSASPAQSAPAAASNVDANAAAVETAVTAGGALDTLELTKLAITGIRATLGRGSLSEAASARTHDSLTKLLSLQARLERDQQMLEDRVVREHPKWGQIEDEIFNALKKHPDALDDVCDALRALKVLRDTPRPTSAGEHGAPQ